MTRTPESTRPLSLQVLPQLVPSPVCCRCEVCCRFPEPDSFLRPYFTENEITAAIAAGVGASHFSDPLGCQIRVVPNPGGEGYLCPAFDPHTSQCTIYESRPLDCQIYPLALLWNATQTEVYLGWDSKCPFLKPGARHEARDKDDLKAYAEQIAVRVEQAETVDLLSRHPRLIGPFQEDVVLLSPLPRVTRRLAGSSRLTVDDRVWFDRACSAVDTPLGAYAFAWHFIWQDLFEYTYLTIDDHACLFAEYTDGIFMPLPPLPLHTRHPSSVTYHSEEGFSSVVTECFDFMRRKNRGSAVSRIENVRESQKPLFEAAGYRIRPKDPDYLYRAGDLAALAGDRYKSQRAAVNRFSRTQPYRIEPYHERHRAACLELYEEWVRQKSSSGLGAAAHHMLRDAALGHRYALTHAADLGLRGSVVWVNDRIGGYTLGYDRSSTVFCVLLEVADRTLSGLAQSLFQTTCRDAIKQGIAYINTLDDSGLPELAKAKQRYRPLQLVSCYVVTEQG